MRAAQQTGLKILAPDQIPPALITPAGSTVTWFGTDTEARYARQPHPTLGASDVQYTFNSLGYRSPEPPAGRPVDALTLLPAPRQKEVVPLHHDCVGFHPSIGNLATRRSGGHPPGPEPAGHRPLP